jgi:DNA sulfur modification protein DndD
MIIKSISIRNFKSFGNNKQTVNFKTDEGELILLTGDNGAGKSSFQESFDFSIFGIVRGKSQKRIPLKDISNRVNKNTEVEINFRNNFDNDIRFLKTLEPTSAKFFENEKNETKRFKSSSKEVREKIVGFNFETYKSFVSMSVSDFANFINLKPEEKRQIVNKLFNLQELDNYLSITKDMTKSILDDIVKYDSKVKSNIESIKNYNQSIQSIKLSGVIDKEREIKTLKYELTTKKIPYFELKESNVSIIEELKIIQNKLQDFENKKSIINQELLEEKLELKNINEKIKVYLSGTCPVCDTKLNDTDHKHNLTEIEESKTNIINILKGKIKKRDSIILEITKLLNIKESKIKEKNKNIIDYNSLVYELKIINKKILQLKEKEDYVSIDEIVNSISELEEKNILHNNKIKELKKNILLYEELQTIFSKTGIRKTIIKNIVTPLNVHLKDILDELNSPYNVKLDDEFNVSIYERLTIKVNPETLSTGEAKKINIAIALSYLKLILKINKLNILFLDEIFSSMKPKNVELTMNILKKFTREHKINIIIVDPEVYFTENSELGVNDFDRIIKIKQQLKFSIIEDTRIG